MEEQKPTTRQNAKKVASQKNGAKISSRQKHFGDSILDEIILILIIAASAVVLISLLSDSMGVVGSIINSFLKGILGMGAIFVPVIAIVYCLWMLMSTEKNGGIIRSVAAFIFIIALTSMWGVIFPIYFDDTIGAIAKTGYYYDNGSFLSGGVVGGWIGSGLITAFGKLGSVFILLVVLLISLILGTGKSFFRGISNAFEFHQVHKKQRREKVKKHAQRIYEKEEVEAKKHAKLEAKRASKNQFNHLIAEDNQEDGPNVEESIFGCAKRMLFTKDKTPMFDYQAEELLEQDAISQEYEYDDIPENTAVSRLADEIDDITEPLVIHSSSGFVEDESDDLEMSNTAIIEDVAPIIPININKPQKQEQSDITHTLMQTEPEQPYVFPPIELLGKDTNVQNKGSKVEMLKNAQKLEDTLKSFGVEATVMQINKGPTVTRYELSPSKGVKVSKIVNLSDDIALNLAASGIRIEAPIPGKAAVGIEVPNKDTQSVYLRSVMDTDAFRRFPSKLAFALGQDIAGNPVIADIAKMPHLLIAGATGSGKSVCINTLITSILYKADPKEVKLLLVDPKVVELSVYNGIPHLLIPVVTDPKKAAAALHWAVREMLSRYNDFATHNVRDISGFNAMKKEAGEQEALMPQIVIIIDELADLMMAAPGEVEDAVCRLAQMARAAGMHLIIATQRPSVDVITGVIKANIPSRLAFSVSSGIDSRTILDMVGAEKLLGKGDMLFYPAGMSKPQRIQGGFVTDKEVENIVAFVKRDGQANHDEAMIEKITSTGKLAGPSEDMDEFFDQAVDLVVAKEKASASMLQRQFRIGYNRAARLIDDLEASGIVGPEDGSKPRKVILTKSALAQMRGFED